MERSGLCGVMWYAWVKLVMVRWIFNGTHFLFESRTSKLSLLAVNTATNILNSICKPDSHRFHTQTPATHENTVLSTSTKRKNERKIRILEFKHLQWKWKSVSSPSKHFYVRQISPSGEIVREMREFFASNRWFTYIDDGWSRIRKIRW